MKIRWLLLGSIGAFIFASPAEAGKLLFWRYEANQNRLTFTTDEGVQPEAKLISNPTRLVIDLPGTVLGQPLSNQSFSGAIKNIRVGQFNRSTTRLVVELEQGYTINPQKVVFRGRSATQWMVDLPQPERLETVNLPSPSVSQGNPPISPNTPPPITATPPISSLGNNSNSEVQAEEVQITNSGLVIDIDSRNGQEITYSRSKDKRQIYFDLEGITVPDNLLAKSLPVYEYGVSTLEFEQRSSDLARLTLNVTQDSPNWLATFSRFGGLILWPKGGISSLDIENPPSPTNNNSQNNSQNNSNLPLDDNPITLTVPPSSSLPENSRENLRINTITPPTITRFTNISSVELNGNQLLVKADKKIKAKADWNPILGAYEIKISNAQLSQNFIQPRLSYNSPIHRLRISQENSSEVGILIQPNSGFRIDPLQQSSDTILTLKLQRLDFPLGQFNIPQNPQTNPSVQEGAIFVPPPEVVNIPTPPPQRRSQPSLTRDRNGRILVVIDPGHGGKDPGAIGIGGVKEKDVIFPISQMVAQILEREGVQVRMTRERDYFVSLQGRTQFANNLDADLFVSIHANSLGLQRPDISGIETYYYRTGRELAATIHRSILSRLDVRDRRIRSARFYVLRRSAMPAVLVETGYLTGAEDAPKLKNPTFRRRMAEAIAAGILEYIQKSNL